MSFWEWANPHKFMSWTDRAVGPLAVVSSVLLITGLTWAFFFIPDDFRQGSTVKIFYIHVPSAMMAINLWIMMLVGSLIWLIRRHHVSVLAAKSAALIGLTMTIMGLITGAVWGKPMWGTYWAWDPRLTAFLVLCLFYIGYMALWAAIEDADTAADLTSILCLVGSVFALASRYAVMVWDQGLHQPATLSLDKETNISNIFWYPALVCIAGFTLMCITLVLIRTRSEIRLRRVDAIEKRERRAS